MNAFRAIGVMSGSSLDGLDISFCEYTDSIDCWSFQLLSGTTVQFPDEIYTTLKKIRQLSAYDLSEFDVSFGLWIGDQVHKYCSQNNLSPDLIGSHGHTVFHNPEKQLSKQVGHGQAIANRTGIPTICDFRQQDVFLGGQGAPLVPIGDLLLFPEFGACINLGGIANLSLKDKGEIFAWDIVPCNQVLNQLANQLQVPFDRDGAFASKGQLDKNWFNVLSANPYFKKKPPKSISNEWVADQILSNLPPNNPVDCLYTYTKHIALQLRDALPEAFEDKVLLTGGGTLNNFLVESIRQELRHTEIVIPNANLINFKEAIIFGFMAVLQHLGKINVLSSVTGAHKDSSSGIRYNPM